MPTKLLVLLAALLLVTAGCGKKNSDYKTNGFGVTTEKKGDTVSLEAKGAGGSPGLKAVASEKGVPLPENFPKDVPLFKDALVTLATTLGDNLQVKTTFKAPVDEGMKFYEEQMKSQGWEVSVMKMEGMNMVTGKKGPRQCSVMFSQENKQTVAVLMVPVAGK